jgi:hypothetical protein
MNNVVDLKRYRLYRAVRRSQRKWVAYFSEPLTVDTKLGDLSDKTLLTLARLGDNVMNLLTGLIMNVLDLGDGRSFVDLAGPPKIDVLDAQLFLIDQIRWECLRRLGWVRNFAAEDYPVVELIFDHEHIKKVFRPPFPELTENHPDHDEFLRRRNMDGEVMIRSLIPVALTAFGLKI